MPDRRNVYKVIIRNRVLPGLLLDWDLAGESEFATLKGAATRRRIAARKCRNAYDTGILTPGGHIVHYTEASMPHLAVAKPVDPRPKKRKLTPRNPHYGE